MNAKRKQAEELIYKVLDTADKTKTNSDYYKKIFAKMDDKQFENFFRNRLPLRFHMDVFNVEPKMYDIVDAFKVLNKPLFEKVMMPHVYVDRNGVPVESKEAMVIYINIKRMKQMNTKKTSNAINIDKRDYKTGLLTSEDKGGKETGREFETLAIAGLDNIMNEFARPKADSMAAMAQMSNEIASKGSVSYSDLQISKSDSLGKNALNIYLMGAHIHSNLVDINYMTPWTAKNKQSKIERK